MSTELEDQIRRLTEALDPYAPSISEDELWHRLDADGSDDQPVILVDLHRPPPRDRRTGWAVLAVAGLVAGLLVVVALMSRPERRVVGNSPAATTAAPTTRVPSPTTSTVAVPPNVLPVVNSDAFIARPGDSSAVFQVLANDYDPDNDPLSIVKAAVLPTSVGAADVTVDRGTGIRFLPRDLCAYGEYDISYEVSDGRPASRAVTGTVTIQVAGPAPVAISDIFSVGASALPLTLTADQLLGNDPDSSSCNQIQFGPSIGDSVILTVASGGDEVVVDRAPGSTSDVLIFNYTVTAPGGFGASAAVTVTVT